MENFIQKYSAIVFVLIIIFGEYYAFVFYFCRFYLELGALFSFLYLSIFHIFFGLLCISYFRSIFTSAGNVNYFEQQNLDIDEIKEFTQKYLNYKTNSKKRLKDKDFDNISNEIEMINKYTYCFKCQIIRPPRAHHCRKCDQCFNRMDHHCQWVGNCVGKQNHKFFILFLFYASITLLIVWSTIAYQKLFGMFIIYNNRPKNLQQRIELIITINISSSLPLFLAIFYLLIFNIQCAFLNITTIESHIDEIKTYKNPFKKMSYIENLKDIFGYNLQFFFLPIKPLFNYEYYQECI